MVTEYGCVINLTELVNSVGQLLAPFHVSTHEDTIPSFGECWQFVAVGISLDNPYLWQFLS